MGLCTLNLDTDDVHWSASRSDHFTPGIQPFSTLGIESSMGLKAVNAGIGEKISPAMNWTSVMKPIILLSY